MTRTAAIVLAICVFAATGLRQALAFDYFEHRYLGNEAYRKALKELEDLKESRENVPTLLGALAKHVRPKLGLGNKPDTNGLLNNLPMEFGDLIALAGDFTEDVGELKALTLRIKKEGPNGLAIVVATRRHWHSACRWLYRSRRDESPGTGSDWERCFEKLPRYFDSNTSPPTRLGSDGYRATREELAEFETIQNYVALASKNRDHFPRHSWKSYTRFHLRALWLAQCYSEEKVCVDIEAELAGDRRLPELRTLQLAQCYSEKRQCDDVEIGVLPLSLSRDDPPTKCYFEVERCAHVLSKDDLLVQALLNEAFAQHYLQDSFASGHIGSKYGECLFPGLICIPKRTLEQTHDSLNELGLDVKIPDPASYVWQSQESKKLSEEGWTAFGDRHLFIREADFHRAIIVHTAAKSIAEVFEKALGKEARTNGPDNEQSRRFCQMCTTNVFPIPQADILSKESEEISKTDLTDKGYPAGDLVRFESTSIILRQFGEQRSLDPRVLGIPVEGWKLSWAYAKQRRPDAGGNMFKLDYMRNTGPIVPNSWGLEVWNLPDLRTSYLFSFGWSWPRQLSPVSLTLKVKTGWRAEDNFTTSNPTDVRRYGWEVSFPSFEVTYEIYRPVALFFQLNPLTNINFKEFGYAKERIHEGNWAAGLRFDLSGI